MENFPPKKERKRKWSKEKERKAAMGDCKLLNLLGQNKNCLEGSEFVDKS